MERTEKSVVAEATIEESFKLKFEAYDTVPVSVAEYQNLTACRVILDMILSSKSEGGYFDSAVLKVAESIRARYL